MRGLAQVICLTSGLLAGSMSPSQAQSPEYKLGADDKLNVRVFEWPDLTGEFSVAPNGSLTLPVVGTFDVTGRQVNEVSDIIARSLQQRSNLNQTPSVIVELKQYRPFYIMGDVQSPGEFAYRPGMTVLQSVSLAGGYFRLTDPGLLRLEKDAITSRGQLRVYAVKKDQLTIRRIRLLAELEGARTITYPPDLSERRGDATISQLMREEQITFNSNRDALAEATESHRKQIELFEREIVSLGAQIETEKRQLRAIQKELEEVQNLVSRGLAPTPRLTLLERNYAQSLSAQQNLETLIIRARQSIVITEQKIGDLRSERRKEITTELQKVTAELDEAREQIATAEQLIAEAESTAPKSAATMFQNSPREVGYTITRRVGADIRELEANGSTLILPGDVVRVERASKAPVTGRLNAGPAAASLN